MLEKGKELPKNFGTRAIFRKRGEEFQNGQNFVTVATISGQVREGGGCFTPNEIMRNIPICICYKSSPTLA